ncbi:MAG: type I-MYXAN CRISPR-associated protein Cmx8 [Cyanobacteria bacterium]|jgi:CRISPR-associated protein Cmx8|nr:type I-MYXAN CRISPR-associated protein Cmx8 [Cyanobacteria bacterium GSL.Bin21]
MSEILELNYKLAELPSAQHRAGLAGLVLMVRELQLKSWFEEWENAVIAIEEKEYGATLRFNLEGLKALFDLTYESFAEERSTTTKIKKYDRFEEIEVTDKKGKTKTEKRYYYSVVIPYGAFLAKWDNSNEEERQGLWVKLWRDMLWNIIRGVPATRNPYNYRCNGKTYSKDAESVWKDLNTPEKATGQSGNYFLGAMASNADNVPTKDVIRYQFLLHFWVFVTQVYRPATLNKDGKREFSSYVLVIPDVSSLIDFCDEFQWVLQDRKSEKFGYLPREAVIDIPEEGALDLLQLIRQRLSRKVGSQSLEDLILGAEVIHAEKSGKAIKIQSISYVVPIAQQIDRYAEIQDAYWCPWFRKQRLINLLHSQPNSEEIPAWNEFDALLSRIPRKWLEDPYFSHDARVIFEQEGEIKMKSEIRGYAEIVYRICQNYVLSKLDSKYELKWQECQGKPHKEQEYNDKKGKVANEAFLAVRSRNEAKAFIDYFASTLYPYVRKNEFADFAEKLFNEPDEIRSLTLLALSSQFSSTKKSKQEPEKEAA